MPKVSTEHKEALLSAGKWGEFCAYRTELILGGTKSGVACNTALARFLGEDAVPRKPVKPEKPAKAEKPPKPPKAARPERIEPPAPVIQAGMIGSMPPPPGPVPSSAFDGKPEVPETVNIRWVMENMREPDVRPDTCPSRTAWGLLCDCRESPLLKANFLRDNYSGKLVVKQVDEGAGDGEAFDGVVQAETIEKILAFREKLVLRGGAVAAQRSHAPTVAGSSPALAPSRGVP